LRARWQIRTTGFEPVQLSVKACVPATKLKKGGLKRKCQKQPFYLYFLLHNYIITDFFQSPLYHFFVFRAYHGAFPHIS